MCFSGRDRQFYGSLLAVLAVSINLSGPWLFIKTLMLFLWFLALIEAHLTYPDALFSLSCSSCQDLSELWMSNKMQSCSSSLHPCLSPVVAHMRPVITDERFATCHLLLWAFMENVLLSTQAFGEMSSCQRPSLMITKNINARPRGFTLHNSVSLVGWRAGRWRGRTRLALARAVCSPADGKSRVPHSPMQGKDCPLS